MSRVYITKTSTGAIWSSVIPNSGVWKKESLGVKFENTRQVGSVTQNFFPFSRKNRRRFEMLDK